MFMHTANSLKKRIFLLQSGEEYNIIGTKGINLFGRTFSMDDYVAGKAWKQDKSLHILEAGFTLFSQRGIESVLMTEVAKAAGVGRMTLFRYFPTKTELAIAVAAWKWEEFIEKNSRLMPPEKMERLTGAQYMRFFVDSFLELYRHHKDILRLNYDFNSFVRNAQWTQEQKKPYVNIADSLGRQFHVLYERGAEDGTLNTDIPERTMFSSTFHIMLAAVTRYAVGLAVVIDSDPESELVMLADMLMTRFTKQKADQEMISRSKEENQ